MKKIALFSMCIFSSAAMAQTIYYGTMNGSVRDYYPNVSVTNVVAYNSNATSGIKGDVIERSARNETNLIEQFVNKGKALCEKEKGYFIDNLKLRHTPFGEYNNVFTEVSANIVCIEK
ncbi:hypothetical protein [Aliivibrio fischeri]|uniref:hypothetical protein n=1 Tax=Aliivibrio fischeri TaxID=668 RepID=UPI0007C45CB6|nr:hypothetical protein [Aliivibrio fischeri]MCE7575784.1 hypothetical protein [Aliivibrio fischeri]